MADFQLHIAVSGAQRPQKKKSTFRQKKNGKKNQKSNNNGINISPHDTRKGPKAQPSQHTPTKALVNTNNTGERTISSANDVRESHTTSMSENPVVDDDDIMQVRVKGPNKEAHEHPTSEDTNKAMVHQTSMEKSSKESTVITTKLDLDAVTGELTENQKTFGTRKNPNKSIYEPSAFTTIRSTAIDTVFDQPLASSSSEKIFATQTTFESMQLHFRLIDVLTKDGPHGFHFTRPTNAQVKTIPHVLAGNDVLVKSETGSGKTLAYLLPVIQKLQAIEPRVGRQDGCLALILAPTRELCLQIQETAEKLTKAFVFLVAGVVVGGEKKKSEKARLRKGVSILIATPGRLCDHMINTQSFNYARLQFLVLDEADRLLDMGFQKQITQILTTIETVTKGNPFTGGRRQNLLVSATINSGVQELARMSLIQPVLIDADQDAQMYEATCINDNTEAPTGPSNSEKQTFSTPHQLQQHFMIVPAKTRLCALSCFLRHELNTMERNKCKIVVFMSTCDAVDFHFSLFQKCTWPSERVRGTKPGEMKTGAVSPLLGEHGALFRLHGNISQHERMTTFKNFCATTSGVLFCTDVAARGLNLPTVQWIVQYDPPTETRDYVHRVGRTARSGNQGSSLLFLLPSESEYLEYLQKQNLSLNALSLEKTIVRVTSGNGKGTFVATRKKLLHEVIQSDLQYLFEQTVLSDKDLFELSCQAFHSFVRSYATHSSDTRSIFHVRGLHFGHIAKSFALREPPASTKLRDTGTGAKKGTLQKRKEREDLEVQILAKKKKQAKQDKRKYAQQVSEFAD